MRFVQRLGAAIICCALAATAGCSKEETTAAATVSPSAESSVVMPNLVMPVWATGGDYVTYSKLLLGYLGYLATENGVKIDSAKLTPTTFYAAGQEPEEIYCGVDPYDGSLYSMSKGESGYAAIVFCGSEKLLLVFEASFTDSEMMVVMSAAYAVAELAANSSFSPIAACYRGALAKAMSATSGVAVTVAGLLDGSASQTDGTEQYNNGRQNGASACVAE